MLSSSDLLFMSFLLVLLLATFHGCLNESKCATKNRILETICAQSRALLSSISILALLKILSEDAWMLGLQDVVLQWLQCFVPLLIIILSSLKRIIGFIATC
jgi:hypothetical protein